MPSPTPASHAARRHTPALITAAQLAARLDEVEGRATWRAEAPGALTPGLRPKHGTTLTLPSFLDELRAYLRTAPPAWDPFART